MEEISKILENDLFRNYLEIFVNLLVGIGTICLAYLAYNQIKLKKREYRPLIDIRIEIDNKLPVLIIENISDIPAKGEGFMFIQASQKDNKKEGNNIINELDIEGLKKEEYDDYIFAKIDFNLGPNESTEYNSFLQSYLGKEYNDQKTPHFIRIEYSYKSLIYDEKFNLVKGYHMLPPVNVDFWTASSANTDIVFKHINKSKELPQYKVYKGFSKK